MKRLLTILLLGCAAGLVGIELQTPASISRVVTAREKFRLSRTAFEAQYLELECRVKSKVPLHGAVFVKDKDGNYFQSLHELRFSGQGDWQYIKLPIAERDGHWRAMTNHAGWHAQLAAGIYEIGISFWAARPVTFQAEIRTWRWTGKRPVPPLKITALQYAESGKVGALHRIKFQLSREYFNPFDTQEVKVDYLWRTPNGKTATYPAFFTADYQTQYHLTAEMVHAQGVPYWELRFLPRQPGKHHIKIKVQDRTTTWISPEQTINIAPNPAYRGLVRVSPRNPKYFEFENGDFFFPVGINLHSNSDFRAESRLRLGPLADSGLRDYELYFKRCHAAGINCAEVWMASWTFALEWSSRRPHYYGVGRYNLANAAKLDRLLELAQKYQIKINLVWDNHGKFSLSPTQEWFENPFNRASTYAVADGGFMKGGENLFKNAEFMRFNQMRNRYLAARYGQMPQIFAMQVWSEVDLVMGFREGAYNDHSAENWHREIIQDYWRYTPLRHLITTHVCGDVKLNLRYQRLWELPEISHLVGDSYRHDRIPMPEQMRLQGQLANFPKPCLITEFGGTSASAPHRKLTADLHSGLWSALFFKQAGTPWLWWHDFVLLGQREAHYRGLSKIIASRDFRKDYQAGKAQVIAPPESSFSASWRPERRFFWQRAFEAMTLHRPGKEFLVWIYNRERLYKYQPRSGGVSKEQLWYDLQLLLPIDFVPGLYQVKFFNTLTGKIIAEDTQQLDNQLTLPPFEDDVVADLRRLP